jgi:hypothetical protein
MLDNQGYLHARAFERPRVRAHLRTRAHKHAHKYEILTPFPRQECLRERASLLRYKYTVCLVSNNVVVLTLLMGFTSRIAFIPSFYTRMVVTRVTKEYRYKKQNCTAEHLFDCAFVVFCKKIGLL